MADIHGKPAQAGTSGENQAQSQHKSRHKVRIFSKRVCAEFVPTLCRLLLIMCRLTQVPRCIPNKLKNNEPEKVCVEIYT